MDLDSHDQQDVKPAHPPRWGVLIVAAVLCGMLAGLADFRFAIPLTMPPRPVADYAVQTAWSASGILAVLSLALVTLWVSSRVAQHRGPIVGAGIAGMMLVAVGCGVIALVASAR